MAKITMNHTADINDRAHINQILQIIRNYCDANDMSMGEYAKAAGVSKAWISRISNEGNKHISMEVASKLLDVAGYKIKITSAGIEIGTRLRKLANHVGPISHKDVTLNVIDGYRSERRESSDSYLTARKLAADVIITPTSENILMIMSSIDKGEYSDIGPAADHYKEWKERTIQIFKDKGVLL